MALSLTCNHEPVGVTHHRVLSCSDFPHRWIHRSDHPSTPRVYVTVPGFDREATLMAMTSEITSPPASHPVSMPGLAVWASPQVLGYAMSVVSQLRTPVKGVGTPGVSEPPVLSDGASFAAFDDLRTGPVECGASAVLLADRKFDPTLTLQGEPRLCTLEPLERPTAVNQPVQLMGAFVRSNGFKAAMQIFDGFGPITSLHVRSHCGSGQGSLYARLYDAVTTVLTVLGGPDMIDAMLVPPPATPSSEGARVQSEQLPEGLSQLTGDIGALIRCQPLGLATISASDHACWDRRVQVLGPSGTVSIGQDGVSWRGPDGKPIEEHVSKTDEFQSATVQAAEEVDLWSSGQWEPLHQADAGLTIATCEATRLSCRTREPESTQKVQELLART